MLTALAIASVAGCSSEADHKAQPAATTAHDVTLTSAQQQHIHLYTVKSATFHKTIETSGVVDFDNDQATSVLAPFSGPVSRILVSVGDEVHQGDALAVVDSPDFATAIGSYRKALVAARTARRLADLDKDLLEHHGVSRREEAQAETDAASAEADRDSARQALTALGVDPKTIKTIEDGGSVTHIAGTIRSPISGTVAEKLVTPGQLLQGGSTLCFTIADLSRVWVMAQVFGSDLASVKVGDTAEVFGDLASKPLDGTVTNIAPVVNPDTRSAMARVVVDHPGGLLKKQMYVRVMINSREPSTGLLVPVSAILRDDENLPFVYVTESAGSFARRPVTLGNRVGDRYDIATGLEAGDKVVVEGGIFVQFMQNQ
ncbi:MAG: efflux RND transporter periplasmic adaptor subunit [Rhodanobacteraceae bacterium]